LAGRGDSVLDARPVVVVVADDFGISEQRSLGIVRAMQEGVVTCTSVMANASAADFALRLARQAGCLDAVGLHLNLTEGCPLCPGEQVPTLLLPAGKRQPGTELASLYYVADDASTRNSNENPGVVATCVPSHPLFRGKLGLREACSAGLVSAVDVEKEVRAQITWFRERVGRVPRHVDGHQHCHVIGCLCAVIARVLAEEGIIWVRIPEECCSGSSGGSSHGGIDSGAGADGGNSSSISLLCPVCVKISQEASSARSIFERAGLQSTSDFAGLSFCGRPYLPAEFAAAIFAQLGEGPCASVEVMTHPGFPNTATKAEDCWDDFDRSEDRQLELDVLCDPALADLLLGAGVVLARF